MSDAPNLEGYVDVATRIQAFFEKYPEGVLRRESMDIREVGERTFIVYKALAYRNPKDELPGQGTAWEPFPGPTPFTKDSELMNAETSAWGRALAALGFEVRSGIATAQDVAARGGNGGSAKTGFASDKQRKFFERLLKDAGAGQDIALLICDYANANLEGGRSGHISRAIDALKEGDDAKKAATLSYLTDEADAWASKQSDLPPPDEEGLEQVPVETHPEDSEIQF